MTCYMSNLVDNTARITLKGWREPVADTLTFIWREQKYYREERNSLSLKHRYFYILWPSIIMGDGCPLAPLSVHHWCELTSYFPFMPIY